MSTTSERSQKDLQIEIQQELQRWYTIFDDEASRPTQGMCLCPLFSMKTNARSKGECVTVAKLSWLFFHIYPVSDSAENIQYKSSLHCVVTWRKATMEKYFFPFLSGPGIKNLEKLSKKEQAEKRRALKAWMGRINFYANQWAGLNGSSASSTPLDNIFCLTQAMFHSAPCAFLKDLGNKKIVPWNSVLMESYQCSQARSAHRQAHKCFKMRLLSGVLVLYMGDNEFIKFLDASKFMQLFEQKEEFFAEEMLSEAPGCSKEMVKNTWPTENLADINAGQDELVSMWLNKVCIQALVSVAFCYTFAFEKEKALSGFHVHCRLIGKLVYLKFKYLAQGQWIRDLYLDVLDKRFLVSHIPSNNQDSLSMLVLSRLCLDLRDLLGENLFSEDQEQHRQAVYDYSGENYPPIGESLWTCLACVAPRWSVQITPDEKVLAKNFSEFNKNSFQRFFEAKTSEDFAIQYQDYFARVPKQYLQSSPVGFSFVFSPTESEGAVGEDN